MRRYLLLIALLILAPAALLISLHLRSAAVNPISASATDNLISESERLEKAIRQALEKHREAVPALLLFDTSIDHIKFSSDVQWATAWITPLDPETGQPVPTEPGLVLAQQVNGEWQVTLPFDPQWAGLLPQVPASLLSQDDKAGWVQIAATARIEAPEVTYTGYRLPWRGGETKALTQSVGHDYYTPSGSAHYAFDFASIGYPSAMFNVHAAKAGKVSRAVWSHPNGDESYANYIVLEDTTTSPVTYQLYLHLAQDSIPVELRTAGTPVEQGQLIGVADDTGISSGNHLHFHVHTYPYSYWGVSVDITFLDVAINGGRPRIASDLPFCLPTDVCEKTQSTYISGNYLSPDSKPPTGQIVEPAQGSTQYAQTVRLSGWATDDSSGFAKAQFLALFNNSWQAIGPLFTSSPFSFDWDVCAAQVADAPIALALQLEDYAQNKTSPLYSLLHFTKNYTCPTAPSACVPTSNQVALFTKPDYKGKCILLGSGTYSTPTSLGSVGDDNTESILVGSSIKATLFSESSLAGRSETLSVNDANLADNRIGANTVSSLLVQSRTATPAAPVALWPLVNASFEGIASLSLAWKDAGGADYFQARLQGPTAITSTWQTASYWHLSMLGPGAYTWQVRGKYNTYLSPWSTARAFQVLAGAQISNPQSPTANVPYLQTFESGALDWTNNNTWNLVGGPNHTPGGSYSIQYQPGGGSGYDTGNPNAGYLTSPPFSLPATSTYYLRFWYLNTTESPEIHWDQRWVQISVNGAPFTNLLQLSDDPTNFWLSSPAISLAPYAGQTIQVRFYFVTLDNLLNNFQGWFIDDVSITSDPPPNCQDTDNSYLQAQPISYNTLTNGLVCPGGDMDYFSFQGIRGDHVGIRIEAQSLGSPLDSYLFFLDVDGRSVLAENDDMVLYERADSLISYWLARTGTYYIKLRAWDHPSAGGLSYTYKLHLYRDNDDPIGFFTYPQEGQTIPAGPVTLKVAATDPTTDIGFVKFFWHSSDWSNANWIELGDDWNGQDGWNFSFDTRSLPFQNSLAFYAQIFDWAGNWLGAGVWNLKVPSIFTPFILRLP